jgi:choline dehydrogenase-like flavoprotein
MSASGGSNGSGLSVAQQLGLSAQVGTRFDLDDSDVVVIIGSGAGGGTLANELCQQGIKTVVLEAGPHLTADDYHQDEWKAFNQMAWLDARTTSGGWRVARDFPNLPAWTVKAVGGTSTHWAGACPRFKDYEFKAKSSYGGGIDGTSLLDWPIGLADLEPFYDKAEIRLGVTHVHGRAPLPANNNYTVFANGAKAVGYAGYSTGPYATNAEPYDGRPASIQDGFNFQGDKHGSKWSTLVAELPKAAATGKLDLRPESHAIQITHDARGRVDAVLYIDSDGNVNRQRTRAVCVACNAIESARLLLLSSSPSHPHGLANASGHVGRHYMRHLTASVYARFGKAVNMHRGETMAGVITDEATHDDGRGFVGGYYMETLSLGVPFLAAFLDPGAWGPEFTAAMDAYQHTAGMWLVGEDMPRESNRVTLNGDVSDQHGLPVPNVHFDDHANDVAMRDHAWAKGQAVYEAVGAESVTHTPPYPSTHNLGTCRMSERPEDGVVDRNGRAHDVPNLFVSDGSVFTTGAAANPTLTIVALAIRQGQHIGSEVRAGTL